MPNFSTPFQKHLSYFARTSPYPNKITLLSALRGNLALGLNFPVSLAASIFQILVYGNTRAWFMGPFRHIDIDRVTSQRGMLNHISVNTARTLQDEDVQGKSVKGWTRSEFKALNLSSGGEDMRDRLSAWGLWLLAANPNDGRLSAKDVMLYQKGELLPEIEKRRKWSRDDRLPFLRGGPGSVVGHSFFVKKLFGVDVYRVDGNLKNH